MTDHPALGEALERAIKEKVEGKDVAVAFSGGLDSGLISALAKRYARSVVLYTCGSDDSFDVAAGKELAEILDLPWYQAKLSQVNIVDRVKEMISATNESDPFTISYELQLFSVCRMAEADIVLSGQGSDEYFMGCNNNVTDSDEEYEEKRQWGIDRLMKVSIPCETKIGKHFGKEIFYPYLHPYVQEEIARIDPKEFRPKDLESRKQVLKDTAVGLGFPFLAFRKKKASQYGSKTTDLIRAAAKKEGMMYNVFIASLYFMTKKGCSNTYSEALVDARVDPMLKYDAEQVFEKYGLTSSQVIEMFYKRVAKDGDLRSIGFNE